MSPASDTQPIYRHAYLTRDRFDHLWRQAQGSVEKTIARWSPGQTKEEREDRVQQTALRAWRLRERFDPTAASFVAWACALAYGVHRDAHKAARSGARPRTITLEMEPDDGLPLIDRVSDPRQNPLQSVLAREEAEVRLWALGARSRRVLLMSLQGRSLPEIAAREGLTEPAAERAIGRARRTFMAVARP